MMTQNHNKAILLYLNVFYSALQTDAEESITTQKKKTN